MQAERDGVGEALVAWMVDCGKTNMAEGDVRFWRASRKYEAYGCALAHGTKAIPLYSRSVALCSNRGAVATGRPPYLCSECGGEMEWRRGADGEEGWAHVGRPATAGGGAAGLAATIAPVDDALLIDELMGFRAQLHPREADGQPIRLVTGNGEAEQTTRNLRAVLWDAAVRMKSLAAAERERDRLRAENDRLRARLGDAPADATPSNAEHDHHG